jgi:uncharacterized protein with HEPN domain
MRDRDKTILAKIKEESKEAINLIGTHDKEEFIKNPYIHRSVALTLINIGELATHLSTEIKNQNNHIPWKDLSSFRNIIAHHYGTLDKKDIWDYAKTEIPPLINQLEQLLDSPTIHLKKPTNSDPRWN